MFPKFKTQHVTGVPEKALFRSVTVNNKHYPVNVICLLKKNKCSIKKKQKPLSNTGNFFLKSVHQYYKLYEGIKAHRFYFKW